MPGNSHASSCIRPLVRHCGGVGGGGVADCVHVDDHWSGFMFLFCKMTTVFKFLYQWAAANLCLEWGPRYGKVFLNVLTLFSFQPSLHTCTTSPSGGSGYDSFFSAKPALWTGRFLILLVQRSSYLYSVHPGLRSGAFSVWLPSPALTVKLFPVSVEALGQEIISCLSSSDSRLLLCIHAGSWD